MLASRYRFSFAFNALPGLHYSCLLPDVPRRLLKARVALFVCAPTAESEAYDGWPRPALKQQHGKDDAEAKAEGRFYQEVGEAAVPLCSESVSLRSLGRAYASGSGPVLLLSRCGQIQGNRTFSFRRASLTGRETVLGGGGGTDVSAILDICVRCEEKTLEDLGALAEVSIGSVEDWRRLTARGNWAERVKWEPVTFLIFGL